MALDGRQSWFGWSRVGWTQEGPQGDSQGSRTPRALLRNPTDFQAQLFLPPPYLFFCSRLFFPPVPALSSSFPPCRKWSVCHFETIPRVSLLTSQVKYAVIKVIIHLGWFSRELPFVLR